MAGIQTGKVVQGGGTFGTGATQLVNAAAGHQPTRSVTRTRRHSSSTSSNWVFGHLLATEPQRVRV